jgi:predicted ATPase
VKIKSVHIDNFKSLIDFRLTEPNPFSVFVGANGVGKSNIFEALEFLNYTYSFKNSKLEDFFGGYENFVNFNGYKKSLRIEIKSEHNKFSFFREPYEADPKNKIVAVGGPIPIKDSWPENSPLIDEYEHIAENFSRIFITTKEEKKINLKSDAKLNFDCDNLELVLSRILSDNNISTEIKEWIGLFRPGFENIEIIPNKLSESKNIQLYEKGYTKPFGKKLISDGTYNILCLLTTVYQSDKPQFLCIEEPENGLNPYVIKELVTFFREQCKEKGHYIWLNTHSQTLVNQLLPEEIIVVNKEEGITKAKQFIGKDMHGMAMDTAWLTNFFGGGVPW